MTARILMTFLTLTIIGCGQRTTPAKVSIGVGDITCTISSDSLFYQKGHAPKIKVKIKNNTENVIRLVKSLDGSGQRMRFPLVYFKIEKIGDTSYKVERYARCGNMNGLDTADFVTVNPGDIFNPYSLNQNGPFADYKINDGNNFIKTGKYKITFYYSTNEQDFKKWMGDSWYEEIDRRTGKPWKENFYYKRLHELFETVPQVDIVSNDLVVEIK